MPHKNKEVRKEYNRIYNQTHREQIYKKHKDWVEAHKDEQKKYHFEYQKKWYKANKEKRSQQMKEYSLNHREDNVRRTQRYVSKNKQEVYAYGKRYNQTFSGGYRAYKSNAFKRFKEFQLSIEDFKKLVSEPCFYCGEKDKRRGIDRIDNSKGYLKDNSASCCSTCNYMKKTFSVEDFISHVRKIYKYKEERQT